MNIIQTALILFVTIVLSHAQNASRGCLHEEMQREEMKKPSGIPLVLQTKLEVLHIRDVPDSGGTYGVDIK